MHSAIIFRWTSIAPRRAVRPISLIGLEKSQKKSADMLCPQDCPTSKALGDSSKLWFNRLCNPNDPEPNVTRPALEQFENQDTSPIGQPSTQRLTPLEEATASSKA